MQYGNDNRLLTQAFLEDKLSQDQNNDKNTGVGCHDLLKKNH